MTVRIKESSPAQFKTVMLDVPTIDRLRVLAAGLPVATYIRSLVNELADGMPKTMEIQKGGYSLSPIKEQLHSQDAKLEKMGAIQVDQFEKTLKALFSLSLMLNFTLDTLEKDYPGIGEKIRSQAEQDRERWFNEEIDKIYE